MIATLMSVIIFKKENIQQRWTNTLYVQGTLSSLEWGPAVMETLMTWAHIELTLYWGMGANFKLIITYLLALTVYC